MIGDSNIMDCGVCAGCGITASLKASLCFGCTEKVATDGIKFTNALLRAVKELIATSIDLGTVSEVSTDKMEALEAAFLDAWETTP